MAPSKPPNAALRDSEIALLRSEYTVLNRLYVRNKNQHRVAVWWKSLSIFRRRLRRIVAPETGKEERARDVEYIRERIASWFVAFITVVKDRAFAPLGAVLLGILARVWSVVGGPMEVEEKVAEDDQNEGIAVDHWDEGAVVQRDAFDEEDLGDDMDLDMEDWLPPKVEREADPSPDGGADSDFSHPTPKQKPRKAAATKPKPASVPSREKPGAEEASVLGGAAEKAPKERGSEKGPEKKKKKKKRSKIDDIFAGLV